MRFARIRLACAAALWLAAGAVNAQATDEAAAAPATVVAETAAPREPAAAAAVREKPAAKDRFRPNGPMTVTATSVDWAKNGMMVYTGEVKLVSDTLNLDGDRLELEQLAEGQYRLKITGNPAHLLHPGEPAGAAGADGGPEPTVTARGKQLNYDSKTGLADVIGDARVTRGDDEITGETIHYNVNERRIQAAGGSGGQIRIVFQPQAKDGGGSAPKPAPANKPPPVSPPASTPDAAPESPPPAPVQAPP